MFSVGRLISYISPDLAQYTCACSIHGTTWKMGGGQGLLHYTDPILTKQMVNVCVCVCVHIYGIYKNNYACVWV